MAKPERQHPFNFGRVFFPGELTPTPQEIRFQPLGDHVGNVIKLVREWRNNDFPSFPDTSSFERVLEAAKIHDQGKPQKFEIKVETTPKGEFKKYIYSFRGHRFLAESKNLWAKTLAIGHHDFSVREICKDAYTLKKEPEYAQILAENPLAYAQELYILEMCDQIEAELACRVLGDEKQAESRTFMDYTISLDPNNPETFFIDPWIFKQEIIELTFKYWSMSPSPKEREILQKYVNDKKANQLGKQLDTMVKNWWKEQQGQPEILTKIIAQLQPHPWIKETQSWNCETTYQRLAGLTANPMQEEIFNELTNNDDPAILLKAPTGSGKLEAILFPVLARNYRLFLPLPTRSLLDDHRQRIEQYLKRLSTYFPNREIALVIDTGSQMYRHVYQNGEDITDTLKINLRRHLYKGDVILTTIDKFIYRYFGFGDKQKSFIFPFRINQDSKDKERKTLICFDEGHTYDDISFTNFQSLVQSLYEAGRSLILMTATLPKEHYQKFNYLDLIDYIDNREQQQKLNQFYEKVLNRKSDLNRKSFKWFNEIQRDFQNLKPFQQQFSDLIFSEWQDQGKRRILTVVETVKDAVEIYKNLKNKIGTHQEEQFLFLYHGRLSEYPKNSEFARANIYKKLKQRDQDQQPYILITTSAIEVGCDLNAEVLISEICPPENLIQRAGRCNRRGNIPDAKVIVLGNQIPDLTNSLDKEAWENYQNTLKSLTNFDVHKIAECISRSQHIDDYRVVELFSMLYNYVYEQDLTCQNAHDQGLVVTRSWTPSVTLIYDNGEKEPAKITVPIDRLIINKENEYANTHIFERYYDKENTHWAERSLTHGSAYRKDIIIKIFPSNEGATMYEEKPDYDYDSEFGFVELPGVFIKLKTKDFDEKLLCHHHDKKQQAKAIIVYKKSLVTDRNF